MSWQKSIVLDAMEIVLQSWDGLITSRYKIGIAKQLHSGTIALTNQRILWFERRGLSSKFSFDIDLLSLQEITIGGNINTWISITDRDNKYIFHLARMGKDEAELFRDIIYKQKQFWVKENMIGGDTMPDATVVCMKIHECSDHPGKCPSCEYNRHRKTSQYKKA